MQAINTTSRGLFVTHCRYTVNIATVSDQYCPYLYYHKIHLCRYICCYYQPMYNNSVIFIIFYFKLSRNFYFIKNIKSIICGILETQLIFSRQINPLTLIFDHQQVQKPSSYYQTKQPLKYGSLSGVGLSWWGISWLRLKYPGFR